MAISINDAWTRIITWLRANAPDDINAFPPITDHAIASTAANMGISFPHEFVEFHRRLSGAEVGSVFPSPDNHDQMSYTPIPLEEVLAVWTSQNELLAVGQFEDLPPECAAEIRNVWWDRGWIPFATNGDS